MRIFKDVSVRSAAFLMAYYVTNSVFQSYMSIYYDETIGLSGTEIGTINALLALVSVFSMQLWGRLGDRARVINYLLCGISLCAAGSMLLLKTGTTFPVILACSCLFATFYTSIQPMGDSIILPSLAAQGRKFGPVRLCGGLSFAVVAMLFGYVVDASDNNIIPYTVIGLCCVCALAALYLPRMHRAEKSESRSTGGMFSLLKNKKLLMLFALMVPLQLTYGYFYAFYSPLMRELGATNSQVGWSYFISAASETPFLLLSYKLFNKYGTGKLMCVSAFVMTIRWTLVATTDSVIVAMLSQLLHCMGFIVITVTVSKYVQMVVPKDMQARGQLLVSVFGFGVARVIGYFGGGVLSDIMGKQNVFYICAGICFVCMVIFIPYYLRRKPFNGVDA